MWKYNYCPFINFYASNNCDTLCNIKCFIGWNDNHRLVILYTGYTILVIICHIDVLISSMILYRKWYRKRIMISLSITWTALAVAGYDPLALLFLLRPPAPVKNQWQITWTQTGLVVGNEDVETLLHRENHSMALSCLIQMYRNQGMHRLRKA